MSRSKKIISLLIVFIVLVGGYFLVDYQKKNVKEEAPIEPLPEKVKIIDVDKDQLNRIELRNEDTFVVVKQGDKWGVENEDISIYDEGKVNDIVNSMSSMEAERVIIESGVTEEQKKEYGLDHPKATVIANLNDGTNIVIEIGNRTPQQNTFYAMRKGVDQVYTVWTSHGNYLSYKRDDLRDRSIVNLDTEKVNYFYIKQKGSAPIEIRPKEEKDEQLQSYGLGIYELVQPYKEPKGVDTNGIDALKKALPKMSIDKFVEDHPTNLEQYGLDQPTLELKLKSYDPQTDETKEVHYLFGNTFDEKYVYFKDADKDNVYGMKNEFLKNFNFEAFTFVEKLIYINNIDNVKHIDVHTKDIKYALDIEKETKKAEKEDEEDEVIDHFFIDGKVAEDGPFRKVYQSIIGISADFEIKDLEKVTEETEESIRIKYTFTDGSTKTIVYTPYNENFYAIQIEDDVYFAVSKMDIQNMLDKLKLLKEGKLED